MFICIIYTYIDIYYIYYIIYTYFKSPHFFVWFMKYSVVAKSSDIKNNGWKVPADEVKQQSLTELENIT